jgi:hypothetical protein
MKGLTPTPFCRLGGAAGPGPPPPALKERIRRARRAGTGTRDRYRGVVLNTDQRGGWIKHGTNRDRKHGPIKRGPPPPSLPLGGQCGSWAAALPAATRSQGLCNRVGPPRFQLGALGMPAGVRVATTDARTPRGGAKNPPYTLVRRPERPPSCDGPPVEQAACVKARVCLGSQEPPAEDQCVGAGVARRIGPLGDPDRMMAARPDGQGCAVCALRRSVSDDADRESPARGE